MVFNRIVQLGFEKKVKKTRLLYTLFMAGFLCLFLVGCKDKEVKNTALSLQIKADTTHNEYAKAFRIIYHPKSVQIDILNPDNKKVIQRYWVKNEIDDKLNVFPRKLTKIVAFSSTEVGMLRKLGLEESIVGVSNFNFLCHPMSHSSVEEVGDIREAKLEKIMALQPDIVFYSGFNMENPTIKKMENAHIKPFIIHEWKETSPLGRAEWIKVYGVLFHKQQQANEIFHSIKQRYLALKQKLSRANKRPTVLSGTYYNGVFNAPAGDSYMAQLLKDANTKYVYASSFGTGSLSLPLEKVILTNKTTTFWLNPSAATAQELKSQNAKLLHIGAFKDGKVYTYFNKKNCFWALSPCAPDKVLEDIGKIVHPELFDDATLTFYEKLQ